ncbi:hypothetical protein K0M31_009824 [Melipona bicolor]|uniref:Uncharacterized protein n=1 Tax=Melipona bicolor TaxID=60889 RepID=A0AA40FMS6_9HYME|nr:hypothetical protein K0M31_009824 [Melipona bicolor]
MPIVFERKCNALYLGCFLAGKETFGMALTRFRIREPCKRDPTEEIRHRPCSPLTPSDAAYDAEYLRTRWRTRLTETKNDVLAGLGYSGLG